MNKISFETTLSHTEPLDDDNRDTSNPNTWTRLHMLNRTTVTSYWSILRRRLQSLVAFFFGLFDLFQCDFFKKIYVYFSDQK